MQRKSKKQRRTKKQEEERIRELMGDVLDYLSPDNCTFKGIAEALSKNGKLGKVTRIEVSHTVEALVRSRALSVTETNPFLTQSNLFQRYNNEVEFSCFANWHRRNGSVAKAAVGKWLFFG